MAKLKQVCNHPAHLLGDGSRLPGRSGKLARLEEICDEIVAEGDKALCFTQYAEFGRMLQPHLAARLGCPVLFLHGGTTPKQRDVLVATFAGLDEPALFLLSLKAGGTWAQPDGGQPRDPRRPVVEPGGGRAGHRPGVPHRPAPARAGA